MSYDRTALARGKISECRFSWHMRHILHFYVRLHDSMEWASADDLFRCSTRKYDCTISWHVSTDILQTRGL